MSTENETDGKKKEQPADKLSKLIASLSEVKDDGELSKIDAAYVALGNLIKLKAVERKNAVLAELQEKIDAFPINTFSLSDFKALRGIVIPDSTQKEITEKTTKSKKPKKPILIKIGKIKWWIGFRNVSTELKEKIIAVCGPEKDISKLKDHAYLTADGKKAFETDSKPFECLLKE